MKHCPRCNRDLPLTHFHKHIAGKDGLRYICKDCARKSEHNSRGTVVNTAMIYGEEPQRGDDIALPEKKLIGAMIGQALHEATYHNTTREYVSVACICDTDQEAAIEWIQNDSIEPFSFTWCLNVLFDEDYVGKIKDVVRTNLHTHEIEYPRIKFA